MGGPSSPTQELLHGPLGIGRSHRETESARGWEEVGVVRERLEGSSTRGCKLCVQASMSHCAHILDLSASFSERCVLESIVFCKLGQILSWR